MCNEFSSRKFRVSYFFKVLPYGESPIRYAKRPGLLKRTSSMSAACPQVSAKSVSFDNCYDQVDEIRFENVSIDVYIYYGTAFGFRSVLMAFALYCCNQVPTNFNRTLISILTDYCVQRIFTCLFQLHFLW